ncbi:MAG: endonuclease/exonuclease/phosphatase family protein [Chloroflexi bacterium]|nr:endonuclease/exonuclease/phosphatase family protein [Chloroflexota bacterium]
MKTTRTPKFTTIGYTLLYSLLFLFFFQLLTDFIAAVYAFGLMGLNIPPEIASVLILFSPILLVVARKPLKGRLLGFLALIVLSTRVAEPLLGTRERMLVAGLGVGTFLVYFPALLGGQMRKLRSPFILAAGLALSLGYSILLRAAGSGVDISSIGMFRLINWALALAAGFLVIVLPVYDRDQPDAAASGDEVPKGNFRKVAGLAAGITAAFTLLYFAFTAPNVIARWTGASYLLVIALISLALVAFAGMAANPGRMAAALKPGGILLWNLLFVLSLGLTLRLEQISFPAGPGPYPIFAQDGSLWPVLLLILTLLLFPVILLDFALFCQKIQLLQPTPRTLGAGFGLASLFLLILIFGQVFTTVYDYIPVVGPLFRDQYWLIYLAAGIGLVLPLREVEWEHLDLALPRIHEVPSWSFPAALGALGLASLALAGVTAARPALPASAQTSLRVLTFNLQQGYSATGQKNYTGQLAILQGAKADVIGLQETDTNRISESNDDLVRFVADHLNMYSYYGPGVVSGTFGIALLSKYPIQNPHTFYMFSAGEQTAAIEAEITKAGKTFHVFVTHLGNGGPWVQQEEFLQQVDENQNVIAMGDFNFDPSVMQYAQTVKLLSDAWLLRWPQGSNDQGYNPSDRIDHIFVSPGTQVSQAHFITGIDSDHPAYEVEIEWR